MRLDKLTTQFQQALGDAQSLALANDNQFIEPVHLLAAIVGQPDGSGRALLERAGVRVPPLKTAAEAAIKRLPQVSGAGGDVQVGRSLVSLLNLTENVLPGAHNVDITALNPGFPGHKFPWHWYLATVAGAYTTDERLADRPVLCRTERLAYGFARAREIGPVSWTKSLDLEPGNSPVRILPPGDLDD